MPAAPEIEAATAPYQPEEPAQPEQLGFDVPQGEEPLRYVGEVFRSFSPMSSTYVRFRHAESPVCVAFACYVL